MEEHIVAKRKTKFVCQDCGYESARWMGKCPGCQQWNTLVEEFESSSKHKYVSGNNQQANKPEKITEIKSNDEPRLTTPMKEFNRVLGGGIVPGSLVLIGGDPGIGKSTLLLQISAHLAAKSLPVLYISGGESPRQTKIRADRLGVSQDLLFVLAETNLLDIANQIDRKSVV